MKKLIENTNGIHIYMRMMLDNKRIEEIDVYLQPDGSKKYVTSADHGAELDRTEQTKQKREALRAEIIRTFEQLY